MRIFRTAVVAVLALAGALLLAPASAQAAPGATCHRVHQQSGPNIGLLNGTNVYAPLGVDLGVVGTALGLLGSATATGTSTVSCGN